MSRFRVLLGIAFLACLATTGATVASAADIVSGDVLWGELTPAATPTWTFQGTAGGSVLIATSELSGTVHPQIYLYSPTDPVDHVASDPGPYSEHYLRYGPLTDGTYTIIIDEALNNSGFYGISVVVLPEGQAPSSTDLDGGTIASGATVTGTLSFQADMDVYQFHGEVGERVVVTASELAGGIQPEIYLYPPECEDGLPEAFAIGSSPSWHRLDRQLAQAGTYTIVVRDNGLNGEATYALAFAQIPGASNSATDTDGGVIASGATMAGQLYPRADTDVFQFEGQAGDRVIITTAETSYNIQPEIYLYPPACLPPSCADPPGPTPWEAADTGDFNEHRLEHVLEKAGTYTIVVNDCGLNTVGTYAIALGKIPGAATSTSETDGGTITSGATLTGTLLGQADTDIYQFYGETGSQVIITTAALTSGPQPEFKLYPPGGGNAEAWTTGALASYRLEHSLLQTGVYTVIVNDSGLNSPDGAYAIALATVPGSATSPGDTDGGAIASGEAKYGTFVGNADTDVFQFYARAGDSVVISADIYSYSSVQPEIFLYPPGGGSAVDSATGSLLPNQIRSTLTETGLYTIVVSDWGLNAQGAYKITFSKSPSTLVQGLYSPFPPDASAVILAERYLRWDAVAGATGYDVYLSSDPFLPLPRVAENITSVFLAFPAKDLDATYRWRVVAHTAGGDVEGPTWWFSFRARGITYSDNFADGDADGDPDWFDGIYAGSRIRTWTVNAGKALLSSPGYDTKAIYLGAPSPFLTGSIQTSLKMVGGGAEAPNAAILFAYDSGGKRFRYVRITAGKLTIGQEGAFGGDRTGVKVTRNAPFAKDKAYVLKVLVDSAGMVKVYQKSGALWRLRSSYKFRKPMPGYTGYWTKKSRGVFDNFVLGAETVLP